MMEAALKDNIIACLGTGTGKTFISVLVIKELAYQVRPPFEQDGRRSFFLVPTVPLVHQQAEVLESLTDLHVGRFFGEMNVDMWSKEEWYEQFKVNNILVMTAEIFRAILQHGFLPLSKVNLIVFDECHRAVKNHPYREIMRNFDLCTDPPKVLGLTASILNGKCKPGQLEKQIQNLEQTLRSKAIIPDEFSEMDKFGTKPKEILLSFTTFSSAASEYREINRVRSMLTDTVSNLPEIKVSVKRSNTSDIFSGIGGAGDSDGDDEDEEFQPLKAARKYVTDVIEILDILGAWCARESLQVFLEELRSMFERGQIEEDSVNVLKVVQEKFESCQKILDFMLNSNSKEYLTGKFSPPKLKKLLDVLKSKCPSMLKDHEPLCCVIFVQKRFVAYILNQWFQTVSKLPAYAYIKSNFVVGHGTQLYPTEIKQIRMESKQQRKVLEEFRNRKFNLLVASSVIEEGMDVPHCNLVIRFDPPSDFRAYVQSKGRARAQNSIFLLMAPDNEDRVKLLEDLTAYNSIEKILQNYCQDRETPTEEDIDYHLSDQLKLPYIPFPVDGGARVTMCSAISLLNRYCSKLVADSFTLSAPRWKIRKIDDDRLGRSGYQCTIRMPLVSPIREPIVGEPMATKQHAKMAAALNGCILLHKQGELNDNLLPINFKEELMKDGQDLEAYQRELRLGASNKKACYPKKVLSFEPVSTITNCYLYIIIMKLTEPLDREEAESITLFDPSSSQYGLGVIVSEPNINVIPFYLFTESGKVRVHLHEQGPFNLSKEQLSLIHKFHEYTFSEMLFLAKFPLRFLPEQNQEWLVAPVKNANSSPTGNADLDWDLMHRIFTYSKSEIIGSHKKEDTLEFNAKDYQDALVTPVFEHNHFYYVIKVCEDLTAKSSFPKDDYENYEQYYKEKHKCVLKNSGHSLLEGKHVSNLLLNTPGYFNQKGLFVKQSDKRLARRVHFPVELVKILPYPGSLYRQAQYLPCVLSRINSLLFAQELQKTIVLEAEIGLDNHIWPVLDFKGFSIGCNDSKKDMQINSDLIFEDVVGFRKSFGPSPTLLLEALTSRSYADLLDLERLETVGDSFLKYAVSMYLFCKYPLDNEGKLTIRKTKEISNANLLKLGKSKGIPSIMCYTKMDPSINWLPPGYKLPSKFEEIQSQLFFQASQAYIDKFLSDIWDLSSREIYSRLLSKKEETEHDIENQLKSSEPVSNNLSMNLRTQNCIGNKSIADCVESLIGAYVVSTGVMGGLYFLNWLGFGIFPEVVKPKDIKSCFSVPQQIATVPPELQYLQNQYTSGLDQLEKRIGYTFKNKLCLLEALWHPSCDNKPITGCYQRLEFLGDAVLDYLITRYLYEDPKRYNPGEVTDIRMALVNNEYFAKFAVKYKFHQHMKYYAPGLVGAINQFVTKVQDNDFNFFEEVHSLQKCDAAAEELEVPKVLGDVVESVAGAIYLDSGLSLKTVWKVFFKLMQDDIEATRKHVPVNPVRELYELFPMKTKFSKKEELPGGKIGVTVDVEIDGQQHRYIGIARNKKTAKQTAAKVALKNLKKSAFQI